MYKLFQGWVYKVEVSVLEIYNEQIRDLMISPSEAKSTTYDIKLVDSKSSDTFVTNLKVFIAFLFFLFYKKKIFY